MATLTRLRLRAVLLAFAVALTVSLSGAPVFAFGQAGHGGGDMLGHSFGHTSFEHGRFGFHHPHVFISGFIAVPFAYPFYAPSPYDTYCNPGSPYYDPQVCWNYYNG